ncbi:hypothetical protein BHE74_00053721 [Ensete ventricosum]|nr:hypothetical protein BHE74_00053721 [Ensete ventricosum]
MIGGWEVAQVTATSHVREASQISHDSIEVGAHLHLLPWGRRVSIKSAVVTCRRRWKSEDARDTMEGGDHIQLRFSLHVIVTIGLPPRGVKPIPMATRPATRG